MATQNPRHSAAKSQKIKAVLEHNAELCQEIEKLHTLHEAIGRVKNTVAKEREVILKAELAAKTAMAMPALTYSNMAIIIDAKASMFEKEVFKDTEFDWLDDKSEDEFPPLGSNDDNVAIKMEIE